MRTIAEFCCQNTECPDQGKRGAGNLRWHGWSSRKRGIRCLFCRTCKRYFSERKGTPLENSRLPEEKAIAVLEHLGEGCGVRKTSRLVRVGRNTVSRLARRAGDHARRAHDELVAFSPGDTGGPVRREVGLRRQEGAALRSR